MVEPGDDHTSSRRSAGPPEELPLDSLDWITIEAAYQALRGAPRYVGYLSLAATDLDAAVRNGDVPAMRRCFMYDRNRKLVGPECELLELAHWDERRLWVRSDGSLEVVEGAFRSRVRPILIYSVKGYAYFVWKPALAKVWPDVFASTPPSPTLTADPAAISTLLTPTPVAEEPQEERPETAAETPPAPSTVLAGNSEWPSAEQLKIAKAPKRKTILRKWPDLCRRYPHTYNADKVVAKEVSGRHLASHVGNVDPETARTFLRDLRTWLTRPR